MLNAANLKKALINKQGGMALPLVLIFSAALLAFGAALLNYSLNERLIAGYYIQDIKKYYLAESGLEAGYAVLQDNFHFQGTLKGALDEGTFTVRFIDISSDARLILAEGLFEDYSLQLKVLVENDPEQGPVITEWLGG